MFTFHLKVNNFLFQHVYIEMEREIVLNFLWNVFIPTIFLSGSKEWDVGSGKWDVGSGNLVLWNSALVCHKKYIGRNLVLIL